jgi:proteic killer suppression protein
VIKSFRCKDTAALFRDQDVPRFRSIERVARRKLLYLNQARQSSDLKVPPGNRLEVLRGSRGGPYSIRINNRWRICFVWEAGDVHDVEIVGYH